MDALTQRALQGLDGDLRMLLADPDEPALTPDFALDEVRAAPAGIGGYVGPHRDPDGDVNGRRLHTSVIVDVRGEDAGDLATRAAAVTATLLGVGGGTSAEGRFLRVVQRRADRSSPAPGPPGQAQRARALRFDILYEFLAVPTEESGVIEQVPLDVHLSPAGRAPRPLFRERFGPGILERFQVFDDPGADEETPSAWAYDDDTGGIVQRSATWGGTSGSGPDLPGTALLLSPAAPAAVDVLVRSQMASTERGVGLVFGWQDPDTYYFVLLDATTGFRRIGRKTGGTFADLEEPAFDGADSYPTDRPFDLKLEVFDGGMRVWLDRRPVLAGADGTIAGPGRVGLLTRRNPTARFWSLEVSAL